LSLSTFGVLQSLADMQPDVDAIYRMTQKTPFLFRRTPQSNFLRVSAPCASPPPPQPPIFPIILFLATTLATGMTGISLHMQWPLTLQLHGSIIKENNWFSK
jgi:hypothetical protein